MLAFVAPLGSIFLMLGLAGDDLVGNFCRPRWMLHRKEPWWVVGEQRHLLLLVEIDLLGDMAPCFAIDNIAYRVLGYIWRMTKFFFLGLF
ncbi:hypothetical protein BVRB_9g219020 [Beta vulgaris subsp. vulgaris]|nr:hypothetical protein BVRB_9g219020 [Beta vulgaris subsp. vulgaris]